MNRVKQLVFLMIIFLMFKCKPKGDTGTTPTANLPTSEAVNPFEGKNYEGVFISDTNDSKGVLRMIDFQNKNLGAGFLFKKISNVEYLKGDVLKFKLYNQDTRTYAKDVEHIDSITNSSDFINYELAKTIFGAILDFQPESIDHAGGQHNKWHIIAPVSTPEGITIPGSSTLVKLDGRGEQLFLMKKVVLNNFNYKDVFYHVKNYKQNILKIKSISFKDTHAHSGIEQEYEDD